MPTRLLTMYSTRAIQDNVIVSHGTLLTCVPEDLAARTIQRELLAQSLNLLHGSAADEPKIKSVKKPDTSGTLALRHRTANHHRISLSIVPLGLPLWASLTALSRLVIHTWPRTKDSSPSTSRSGSASSSQNHLAGAGL